MKKSGAYPDALGEALVLAWRQWSQSSSCSAVPLLSGAALQAVQPSRCSVVQLSKPHSQSVLVKATPKRASSKAAQPNDPSLKTPTKRSRCSPGKGEKHNCEFAAMETGPVNSLKRKIPDCVKRKTSDCEFDWGAAVGHSRPCKAARASQPEPASEDAFFCDI